MKRFNNWDRKVLKWGIISALLPYLTLLLPHCLWGAALTTSTKDIKVMIIDTGVDTTHTVFDGRGIAQEQIEVTDAIGHGTAMASLIVNGELGAQNKIVDAVCPQVKLHVCKIFVHQDTFSLGRLLTCLQTVADDGDFFLVNMSFAGEAYYHSEHKAIKQILEWGTKVVTAPGNEALNLIKFPRYPSSYKKGNTQLAALPKLIVVENIDAKGERVKSSNWGLAGAEKMRGVNVLSAYPKNKYAKTTGSSVSAALWSHKLLKEECLRRGMK